MRIVELIPGIAGTFYCENCLRDKTRIQALRRLGHEVVLSALYLPLRMEDSPASIGPQFFGGINVYLQQKSALFRKTPRWVDRVFDSKWLLNWVAGRAGVMDPRDLAETTLSMLRGEDGRQAKELERLVEWLASGQNADLVYLSNALLAGMVRRIKAKVPIPVVCSLQDEDSFLDELPEPYRRQAWDVLRERAAEIDAFVAPSRYFADLMRERLGLPQERLHVVPLGIAMEGYEPAAAPPDPPAIGFLSRLCRDKGLDILAEAFAILKSKEPFRGLRLRAAGGHTADDEAFLSAIRRRLEVRGLAQDVELLPNLLREERQEFLRTLSVLSVPARAGEAFGLFTLEALACGVPVVQPRHGAFPELLAATGGGLLFEPGDPRLLADALEQVLLSPKEAAQMGSQGRQVVSRDFTVEKMVENLVKIYEQVMLRSKNGRR